MMKKRLFTALLVALALCAMTGCQDDAPPPSDFPLEEKLVAAAAEQAKLMKSDAPLTYPEIIEAAAKQAGLSEYFLRQASNVSSDETVGYTLVDPSNSQNTVYISRKPLAVCSMLKVSVNRGVVLQKPDFSWENWKRQLVFAALLSGGFADEEEVYRAFSQQELPEPEKLPDDMILEDHEWLADYERYQWSADLPTGYCNISYILYRAPTSGTQVYDGWEEQLTVSVYESEAHYEGIEP